MSDFAIELEIHLASLRRYAKALLRDRTEAEDLVQESLARALSGTKRVKPGTNLRAWLFTIMHNVHVNQIRHKAARPDEVVVDDLESVLVSLPRQEIRMELRDMQRALDALPEEQRQVILLVALEGLKYEEVAAVLGIPVGTVMSRLSRAREAIRLRVSKKDVIPLRRVK